MGLTEPGFCQAGQMNMFLALRYPVLIPPPPPFLIKTPGCLCFVPRTPGLPPLLRLQEAGAQVLAFDGRIARLEGAEPQPTAVLIAFESLDAAKAWYDMPAYQEAMKLRHASTDTTLLIAEGI